MSRSSAKVDPGTPASGGAALSGARVLLLRSARQSAESAALLERLGATPVVLPLVELLPPPDPSALLDAARRASGYDLVVFTSENAVLAFLEALRGVGLGPHALGATRVAAIGSSTSEALASAGVRVDLLPARYVGEDLGRAILDDLDARGGARGKRVLVPRALVAREVLPEALRAAGALVDVVPAYERRRASDDAFERLRELVLGGAVDVVLLTASSLATDLADALGDAVRSIPTRLVVASIGEITTRTAERRGLRVDVTALESTLPGLLEAVAALLAGRADDQ